MKNKIRSIIGIILILIGVIIVSWVGYEKYTAYKEQQRLKNAFNDVLNQSYEENIGVEEKKDESKDIPPMGLLKIPKFDLETAIVDGVDLTSLRYAIGHFPETAKPGEKGNFSLAAHNDRFFKEIDNLVDGDEIQVKTKKTEFTYEVTDNFIVNPEDVSVLEETEEATITLVTCTPGGKQRVIIKGKLKE